MSDTTLVHLHGSYEKPILVPFPYQKVRDIWEGEPVLEYEDPSSHKKRSIACEFILAIEES